MSTKNTKKLSRPLTILHTSRAFRAASAVFYQIVFFLVLLFDTLFYRLQVIGRCNLHLKKAFLVSNHSLYLDPGIVGQAVYPRRTHFTALEETFYVPVLGPMIRLLGAFPLPEKSPMKRLIGPVKEALDTMGFVHFFPEGDLSPRSPKIAPFRDGAFFFSFFYKVPVVPLTIVVRQKKRRDGGFSVHTGILPPKVRIVIGKPIYPEQFLGIGSVREAMHAMSEEVRRRMQETIDLYQ